MSYVESTGRRHRESTETPDKAKAYEFYYKRKTEIAEGKFLDKKKDKKIKFEEFADKYLKKYSEVQNRGWKKSDWVYIRALKKYFSGYFLSEITKELVDSYRAMKKAEGTKNGGINRIVACLKCMFNRAIEWGDFDNLNPVAKVKKLQEPSGRTRYLEKEDLRRLIDCCEENFKPYVLIAFHTGLRYSEQLNLEWSDLDFKNSIVSIRHTKNGNRRILPMNDDVKKIFSGISKQVNSPFIFCHKKGKPNINVRGAFEKAKKRASIADFHWHDIRHTTASHLAMSGIDLYTIKNILGHSTITMTERYAHLSPSHKNNAIAVLNGVVGDINGHQMALDKNSFDVGVEKTVTA